MTPSQVLAEAAISRTEEIAGFLPKSSPPLYCTLHHAPSPRGVVVLVPPFAEEKKAAQRALVEAARAFSQSGLDVWRFDFRGTGDSLSEFGDCDVEAWLADLRAVLQQARESSGERPLHVVGLRFGAALAWLAADESLRIDSLALWEPVLSGAAYMKQNRQRSQIRRQMTGEGPQGAATPADGKASASDDGFDFDGFEISSALHRQMVEIDLLSAPVPNVRRLQVLQISGSSRIKKPLEELKARAQEAGLPTELENISVEAFWSAIGLVDTSAVREKTMQWIVKESSESAPGAASTCAALESTAKVSESPAVVAEVFDFLSGDQRVRGVLYRPEAPVERAILLLHGWSGYRIGPGHLLTEAARELAASGYAALSFDFRGRGESEWNVNEASLNSMIRDAARAIPLLLEKSGAEKVTLLGLCSGAEVALGASLSDARVDSLALWSAPIFSGAFTTSRQLRRGRESARKYLRKLFLPETWAKLATGRLNFKMIARALSGGRSNEDAQVKDKAPGTEDQMKEFEAFGGRLFFVYAGNDPETAPSRDFYRAFVERTSMPHQFHEVAGANHNYYSLAWKREIIGATLCWLRH